jgi:GT2 family glycosyltransferase
MVADVRDRGLPSADVRAAILPAVAVILVHWAKADVGDTLECLESLARVDYPELRVFLVNNGCPVFPEATFRRAFSGLVILTSERNRGFAGGNNLGIATALADGAELVLLLNNDTVVRADLIRAMLPAFAPRVGIVGPVITYYDRPERIWFAGGTFNRWLGFTFHTGLDERLDRVAGDRPTDFVTGCALFVRRDVFERVGTLWEALFIYFEDAEFCLRAAGAGYRCAVVGEPLVRHKVSASMGERGANPFSPQKGQYFGRNAVLMLRRSARGPWRLVGLAGFLGVIVPYNALQCLRARNLAALRGLLRGVRDGLVGRTGPIPAST